MTTTAAETAVEPPKSSPAIERRVRREREQAALRAIAVAAPERGGLHPDPLRATRLNPPLEGKCPECAKRVIAAWLLGGTWTGECAHREAS